jgi:hypothetical protein
LTASKEGTSNESELSKFFTERKVYLLAMLFGSFAIIGYNQVLGADNDAASRDEAFIVVVDFVAILFIPMFELKVFKLDTEWSFQDRLIVFGISGIAAGIALTDLILSVFLGTQPRHHI